MKADSRSLREFRRKTINESIFAEFLLDDFHRALHAFIVEWKKTKDRQKQYRGVQGSSSQKTAQNCPACG